MKENFGIIHPRKPTELAHDCPIDIYLSGCDGGGYGNTYFPWPYRMNRPKEIGQTYVDASDAFILDSGIHRDEIRTEDVIADALTYGPDYVIAADVLHNPRVTTDRIHEFLHEIDARGVDAGPILPLQPSAPNESDHVAHYLDVSHLGDHFAIGGVKDAPASVQRDAVEAVRAEAGDGVKLHGLGLGIKYLTEPRVIGDPLLDSLDCSTPIQQARRGMYWTLDESYNLIKWTHPSPSGTYCLLEVALQSGLTLVSLARMVYQGATGGVDPEEVAPNVVEPPVRKCDDCGRHMEVGGYGRGCEVHRCVADSCEAGIHRVEIDPGHPAYPIAQD